MNLRQLAELFVEAFTSGPNNKGDEEYFYVIADALDDLGDHTNATRIRNGKWDITDYFGAIEELHGDLLEKIKKAPDSTIVELIQGIKQKYLIDFLIDFSPRKEQVKIFCDPILTCRHLGKAARTLAILNLNGRDLDSWIVQKYRECLRYGLYKDAAKWRKMGKNVWNWKAA